MSKRLPLRFPNADFRTQYHPISTSPRGHSDKGSLLSDHGAWGLHPGHQQWVSPCHSVAGINFGLCAAREPGPCLLQLQLGPCRTTTCACAAGFVFESSFWRFARGRSALQRFVTSRQADGSSALRTRVQQNKSHTSKLMNS